MDDPHDAGGDKMGQFLKSLIEDSRYPTHQSQEWMIGAGMDRSEFDIADRFVRFHNVLQSRW